MEFLAVAFDRFRGGEFDPDLMVAAQRSQIAEPASVAEKIGFERKRQHVDVGGLGQLDADGVEVGGDEFLAAGRLREKDDRFAASEPLFAVGEHGFEVVTRIFTFDRDGFERTHDVAEVNHIEQRLLDHKGEIQIGAHDRVENCRFEQTHVVAQQHRRASLPRPQMIEAAQVEFAADGFEQFDVAVGVFGLAGLVELSASGAEAGFAENVEILPVKIKPAATGQVIHETVGHMLRRVVAVAGKKIGELRHDVFQKFRVRTLLK
ncbi:hypothetical protein SDC9_115149 [bioreactor metagenome]|uniref:Uncharacterized protein n=1 Tax=bioreactor metagenome TaxID=1076179 RepID=A0A645BT12_9ZZZZ